MEYTPSQLERPYTRNEESGEFIPTRTSPIPQRQINPADLAFLRYLEATDAEAEKRIRTYREYYDGNHATQLTKRMEEFLEVKGKDNEFNLNMIPIPIDTLSERLNVVHFKAIGEDEDTPADQRQGGEAGILWQWWIDNNMDEVQEHIHTASSRDGDAFLIVSWDNDNKRPSFTFEPAYDGTYGVTIRYEEGDSRTKKHAVKRWRIETGPNKGRQRMNVYLPDRIYKYIDRGGGWEPYHDAADGDEWPVPWTDGDGAPIGIPVFHYRSNAGGDDYGRSDIRDLIPIQNALNKAVIDEIASADMMGFPMLTVNGETPGEDVKVAPGMLLWTVQHESKYQLLNGADISGLSTLVKNHIVRFAQVSRIPLNYFQVTGQIASDDTQKADETGLVSKAGKRAKSYGTVWSEVMKTARTLSNIYGRTRYDDTRIMVEWGPFTRIDESADEAADTMTRKTKADTYDRLLMLAPGADRYKLAKVAGYNDEEAAIVSATLEDGEITQ